MNYGVMETPWKQEAPWHDYQKMLKALFDWDYEIEVGEVEEAPGNDASTYILTVKVNNREKYEALVKALPDYKLFGNVQMAIRKVNMDTKSSGVDWKKVFLTLFGNNAALRDVRERVDERTGVKATYVRFEPKALQFHSDSVDDYDGNTTMLAADMAREVFSLPAGIFLCTGYLNELPY